MQRFHGVFIRRRETVLRCEVVVDGNDDGLGDVCHAVAEIVKVSGGGAVEDEAAAVVEHDEGKPSLQVAAERANQCFVRNIDPSPGLF